MRDDRFSFERESADFPFYKANPKLSKLDWILILVIILIFLFYTQLTPVPCIRWVVLLLPIIVTLIISRFKISLIFKKLTKKDIPLIFKLTILSMISVFLLCVITSWINFPPDESLNAVSFGLSVEYLLQTVKLAFCLVDEELFKFFVFILSLAVFYKLSNNRKMGVVFAAFVTMILFGAWHFTGYGGSLKIIECIIFRGFGSICEVYSYVKTKNVLVSYFIHLLYDISLLEASVILQYL
ncbi:MAG: hypothetical protein MJ203_00040 [archaeon]|nr:hypothetical protein [archaeon]